VVKQGHIKSDCPNNQIKEKPASKKVEKSKGRRAYISWEENEVSSTSSSSTIYFLSVHIKEFLCSLLKSLNTLKSDN